MHAVHWEDYLMEGLIDLIESLRYLIKKYGRRGKANKRYRAKYCLLRDTHTIRGQHKEATTAISYSQ